MMPPRCVTGECPVDQPYSSVKDVTTDYRQGAPCDNAASRGHLECLVTLRRLGYSWATETCAAAARHGRLACLQYLHDNGCSWNEVTCGAAAARGHLACLEYAHN